MGDIHVLVGEIPKFAKKKKSDFFHFLKFWLEIAGWEVKCPLLYQHWFALCLTMEWSIATNSEDCVIVDFMTLHPGGAKGTCAPGSKAKTVKSACF